MKRVVLVSLVVLLVAPACYRVHSSSSAPGTSGEKAAPEGYRAAKIIDGKCYVGNRHLKALGKSIEPENVEIEWTADGTLVIDHDFDCDNCAFELVSVVYKVDIDTIEIIERSMPDGVATCRCYNVAHYKLIDVPPGSYRLRIYKHYVQLGKPGLTFETDIVLPAGEDTKIMKHDPEVETCGEMDGGEWQDERLREFEEKHGL